MTRCFAAWLDVFIPISRPMIWTHAVCSDAQPARLRLLLLLLLLPQLLQYLRHWQRVDARIQSVTQTADHKAPGRQDASPYSSLTSSMFQTPAVRLAASCRLHSTPTGAVVFCLFRFVLVASFRRPFPTILSSRPCICLLVRSTDRLTDCF